MDAIKICEKMLDECSCRCGGFDGEGVCPQPCDRCNAIKDVIKRIKGQGQINFLVQAQGNNILADCPDIKHKNRIQEQLDSITECLETITARLNKLEQYNDDKDSYDQEQKERG